MTKIAEKNIDVVGAILKVLTNRTVITIVFPIALAIYIGNQVANNPSYWISMLTMFAVALGGWLVFYASNKNNNYLSIALFCLLFISPFFATGMSVKGHIRLNELLLFAVIPTLFVVATVKGEKIKFGIVDIWFIIMASSMLTSIFRGYSSGVSPAYVDFSYVIYVLMFWCYFKIGQKFDVNKKVIAIAIVSPIICILIFDLISLISDTPWGLIHIAPYYMPGDTMQRAIEDREVSGFFRLSGIMGDPNVLASIIVILLALLMSWRLYIHKYDLLVKIVAFVTFIIFILTFSRNGIIIFVLSQAYLLWFARRDGVKRVFRKTAPYFAVLLLGVPFLYKFLIFQFRFNTLFGSTSRKAGLSDLESRIALWKDGFQRAMTISPWWGRGAMSGEPFDNSIYGSIGPHNEYVSILVYGGIIGLLLHISFFIYMFWKSNKLIIARCDDRRVMFLCRSIQAIIVALAVFSMADGFWYNNVIPPILMILFGVMHSFDGSSDKSGSLIEA